MNTCKHWEVPDRYGGKRLLVYVGQLVDDHGGRGEDPVRVEEGVEEVYGEEAQVRQPLQQALHAGISDLWHLAGVERLAEANVDIVFVQSGIRPSERKHHMELDLRYTYNFFLFFPQPDFQYLNPDFLSAALNT